MNWAVNLFFVVMKYLVTCSDIQAIFRNIWI